MKELFRASSLFLVTVWTQLVVMFGANVPISTVSIQVIQVWRCFIWCHCHRSGKLPSKSLKSWLSIGRWPGIQRSGVWWVCLVGNATGHRIFLEKTKNTHLCLMNILEYEDSISESQGNQKWYLTTIGYTATTKCSKGHAEAATTSEMWCSEGVADAAGDICDLLRSHPTMVTLGAVSFLNWGNAFGLLMGHGWKQQIHVSIWCFQRAGASKLQQSGLCLQGSRGWGIWPTGDFEGQHIQNGGWKNERQYHWLVVWNMNFIFPNSWDDDPIWLIFLEGVETTNQIMIWISVGGMSLRSKVSFTNEGGDWND